MRYALAVVRFAVAQGESETSFLTNLDNGCHEVLDHAVQRVRSVVAALPATPFEREVVREFSPR
eukprot:8627565-Pyramimonas_sp.AAC.1